ncbi:MAG: MASE3 domain-containing protein [Desulfobaccales bacterium]
MMTEPSNHPSLSLQWFIWALVLTALYLTSLYSYLLFHSLAELFSVVISVGVFAIAWNSRRFLENNYLLFLGIAYLFVGALDLFHALAYKGMGVFPGFGANLPTQLWIAARYLESISLVLAPLFLGRRLKPYHVFAAYFMAFALLTLTIFFWRVFPVCFVGGSGLTPFKITSEYIICLILLGAITLLWRHRDEFDPGVLRLLVWSIILTIGSELAFTYYVSVYGLANLVGHFLKIISFYLVYKALIETGLMKPYHLLFRNLKLSEEAVRRERDFIDRLIETAQALVVVLDRQGRIVRFNRACETITGYRYEEVKDRPFWEVVLVPEEVEAVREVFHRLTAREFPFTYENYWVARDGTRRLIAWANTALTGEDGSVEHVIATGIDITDQRAAQDRIQRLNAELELKLRELEVTNRELESFTYSVSHDLRAPLRWISGFARALEEDCAPQLDSQGQGYLQRIQEAVRQMGELIDALLLLSRMARAEMRRQPVDLSAQAQAIAADLKGADPERRVEVIIEDGLTAEGDPTMLRAVLENLLGNAWKFTGKVPRARIEFGALPPAADNRGFFVRDNGAGFDMAYVDKLFGAFQRLHGTSDFAGTGIGLATVQRIIHRHGGRVWAEGVVGQGATFYFTLPPPAPGAAATD